jgi:hypothetical protein
MVVIDGSLKTESDRVETSESNLAGTRNKMCECGRRVGEPIEPSRLNVIEGIASVVR